MGLKFKRIISKGNFIPEIDGLRFIAISSVLLFHLSLFLQIKDTNTYDVEYNFGFLNKIFSLGHLGVPLFFVISGFILALPFAKMYLSDGSKVNLKNFFLRRVTRLEPPYILIMTILLFGAVYIAKTVTLQEGLISYLSSITYSHNFLYGKGTLPLLNVVAWSLEIEIQFYILMPLLAKMFLIKKTVNRRIVVVTLALLFIVLSFVETLPFISIINYLQYFLIGFLLADIYVSANKQVQKIKWQTTISVFFFVLIWLLESFEPHSTLLKIVSDLVQLTCIFIFYYLVIIHRSLNILTKPIMTNIGGMCYTIYLLHYPLISMFGNQLIKVQFSNNSLINITVYSALILLALTIASALFFLLVERPCMDKDWYKNIFNRKGKSLEGPL